MCYCPASMPATDLPLALRAKPFNLLRWFAWLSPVVIALTALANAWLISSFLSNHLFQREAAISREFVQNILLSDGSLEYLAHPADAALAQRFRNSIEHLSNMRDVLRANVFSADRSILWSSDRQLIGRRFADNDELEEAMTGELVVHAGRISADSRQKREHEGLNPSVEFFVESYIPILRAGNGQVVGVVELYKAPLALTEAIRAGRLQVGLAALVSALVLYLTLFWLVRRADSTIKRQHAQLLEAETLAVIGELASAVAHNIRNPLASIRSAAELALASPGEDCTEQSCDIVREVDRISARINELLRLSGNERPRSETVDLGLLLQQCIADSTPMFASRGHSLSLAAQVDNVAVAVDPVMLQQVFHSIFSNAAEAMTEHGVCQVTLDAAGPSLLRVVVADAGSGVSPEALRQVFRPFFTTKPQGMGLGLPLARRIVERFGGTLSLHSAGRGTTVTLLLPKA